MFDLENKSIRVKRFHLNINSFSRKLYVSDSIKICMISRGEGIWQIGSKCYTVKENDIVVLNNRQKRVFKEVSPTEGIEIVEISFEPQLFIAHFQWLLFHSEEMYSCIISNSPEIVRLFAEIEMEKEKQLSDHRIIMGAKLVEILSLIGRYYNITDAETFKAGEDMHKVLSYINENYTSNISLYKTAELLHMSESSFSKYFLKYMGMGYAQYIMHKRITYAIHLLQSSKKTVLEIALECGYNNTASFYKAFKKITHLTPKDYKNMKEDCYI